MIDQDEAGTAILTSRPGTVERAFQLAEFGECRSLLEIERRLRKEGFENAAFHLSGMLIRTQLRRLMAGAARPRCPQPS